MLKKIKKKSNPKEYYNLDLINEQNCQYNMIMGQRSNGKTYSVLKHALEVYQSTGGELAIIRRWDTDFKQKRAAQMFEGLVDNGFVSELTGGEWSGILYYSGRWYFSRKDPETFKTIKADDPFAYAFSITSMEHDKSTSYPRVTTILFDEFLTRDTYIPDEFVKFLNVVSTIVRYRDNVTVYMLGNTVNQYCPYFDEMGLYRIKEMEPGDIDVYTFGDTGLKVAVEYSDYTEITKKSNVYFAFDNPKLKMITGGMWEIAVYPHLPRKYRPKDILFTYFIQFNAELLQCEIINVDDVLFTFIHRKTTPLKDETTDLIFSPENNPRRNWRRRITKAGDRIGKTVLSFFQNEKVYYQDNTVGEIVRNYLLWCGSPLIQS